MLDACASASEFLSEGRDVQPPVLETGALPVELRPMELFCCDKTALIIWIADPTDRLTATSVYEVMRRMNRNALAAVLAAAATGALAAGCSNTVEPTATVAQYASALSGPIKDFQKAFNDYSRRCPLFPSRFVCPVSL